ncbi:MAG TPA: hypothetical protein VGY55_08960 [Pirellulales bacterium]|jgi:hypothetical protein|nr:hypothetical protein [Pirellulales bacterium]
MRNRVFRRAAQQCGMLISGAVIVFLGLGPNPRVLFGEDPDSAAVAVPVPDSAALEKASKVVKQLFKDQIDGAKIPAAKLELAKSLLQKGIDAQGDPAGRYVLLRTARDFAVAALDSGLAVQAVDEMARAFQLDGLPLKLETLTTVSKATLPPVQAVAFVETTNTVAEEAIAADNYDVAKQALALGVAAAKKTRDADLIKHLVNRGKETEALEAAFAQVKSAQVKLETKPLDLDANLAVGRYRALVKGDWDGGIPMLALGGDPKLKALAIQELSMSDSGDELLKLADAWWDYAAGVQSSERDRLEGRSLYWYEKALPLISGLSKARVEKRLQEASAKLFGRIQNAVHAKKISYSRTAGSNRGAGFIDVLEEGGLLVGLEIGTIDVDGERYIRAMRPIYRSPRGEVFGQWHGPQRGNNFTLKAREGYAVGGLTARASGRINGLSITFMQIEGIGLNPRDSYTSQWVGGQGNSPDVHLGGSGSLAVGLAGATDQTALEEISLVSVR